MKILVIGDPHGEVKKIKEKGIDLVLITGDLGKATLARKHFFDNIKRKQEGILEKEYTKAERKAVVREIHDSTLSVLKFYSKIAPVYTLQGNVGINGTVGVKEEREKYGINVPNTRVQINKIRDVNLVKNRLRNLNGLRIGFLEYFVDTSWVKEFKPKDYDNKLREAKKETDKAKRILKGFNGLDILVCHQPPFGILDEVTGKYNPPKSWIGKHAGSKVILDYIKRAKPKYVFCGHIHEAKGKESIGETDIFNVGYNGDYLIVDID